MNRRYRAISFAAAAALCVGAGAAVAFADTSRGLGHSSARSVRGTTDAETASMPTAGAAGGDLYLDDFVGFHGCALTGGGLGCEAFDFNGDGMVNLLDYGAFMILVVPGRRGDACGGPRIIDSIPYSTTGTTCGFTDDYDEICPWIAPGAPDVVYSFTATSNMLVDVTLCLNSNYDTKVYVYEDECGAYQSGLEIECNDDACATPSFTEGDYVSQMPRVPLLTGHTYYVVIDGYGTACGAYTLDIEESEMVCGPGNGNCFVAHATPGCELESCCELVCAADAFCCGQNIEGDGVWDGFCVQTALSLCGPPPPECPAESMAGGGASAPTELWVAGASDLGWYDGALSRLEEFSGVASPICQVRWWGLNARTTDGDNYDPCIKSPDSYRIRFHANNSGVPGAVVCDQTLTPTRTATATFYAAGGDLYPLVQYDATLPECCDLNAGWLSVQGSANVNNCVFLWMSGGDEGAGFHVLVDGGATVSENYDLSYCLLPAP